MDGYDGGGGAAKLMEQKIISTFFLCLEKCEINGRVIKLIFNRKL